MNIYKSYVKAYHLISIRWMAAYSCTRTHSPPLTFQSLFGDAQACPGWPAFWGSWTARCTELPWRHTWCGSWSWSDTLGQFLHTWSPVVSRWNCRELIQTARIYSKVKKIFSFCLLSQYSYTFTIFFFASKIIMRYTPSV